MSARSSSLALAGVIAIATFILDLRLASAFAIGILYVGVVAMVSATQHRRGIVVAATLCSIMTVIGFAWSLRATDAPVFLYAVNRSMTLFAIWIVTLVCNRAADLVGSRDDELAEIVESKDALAKQHDSDQREAMALTNVIEDLNLEREHLHELAQTLERQRESESRARELAEQATASATHFEALVSTSSDAIIGTSLDARISSWNKRAELLFGYTASEAIGQSVDLIIPKARREEEHRFFAAIRRGEAVEQFDTIRRHRDGTAVEVSVTVSPITNAAGNLVGISKIARDITEQRELEKQFRIAIESAPNAMLMIESSGSIVLANREAERLFGYSRADLIGAPIERLVPTRYRDQHPTLRSAFFADPAARPMGAGRDLYAERQDSTEFPVEIGLNPISTSRGDFVMSSVVDLTERKRVLDELQYRNQEMEQLLYTVSHDLKSPLVTVQGFAGFALQALEDQDYEDAKDSAARVAKATKTMEGLINDLLALSRVGRADEPPERVEIASLVEQLQLALASDIENTNATLEVEGPLPTIITLPKRVYQIFQNLVVNALKHGCTTSPAKVCIGCLERPSEWRFYVRDFGPGIPEQYHEKVFLLFQQLKSSPASGTGLGLAIVAKAARSLGGRAWIETPPGPGTTFWFSVAKRTSRMLSGADNRIADAATVGGPTEGQSFERTPS